MFNHFFRGIAKKRKEYEYKIQRHTKCKEDYLRYIQYEMDLLKLVRQRRDVSAIYLSFIFPHSVILISQFSSLSSIPAEIRNK